MQAAGFSEPTDVERMIDTWCRQAAEADCTSWKEFSAYIEAKLAALQGGQRRDVEAILAIMLAARGHRPPPLAQ